MPSLAPDRPVRRRRGGRSARVRAAVYAAVIEEFTEAGYTGLSAARIADRAGVHRTTIFRRWPDLDRLLAEAFLDQAGEAIPIPDTGNVRDDLRQLLRAIAPFISNPAARQRIRALVAGAARSPDASALAREVWLSRFALGAQVITRAVERGEVRSDIAPSDLIECFVGPLYIRLLITDEPIDDDFVETIIDVGLAGMAPRP